MEKLIYRPILEKIEPRLGKNRIVILIGARQTGKTSLMRMLRERIERATPAGRVLFYDCERVEYREIFAEYERACAFLKGQAGDLSGNLFLFLDEFQKVPNISNTLKLIADHQPGVAVVASGSSSLEIRKQMEDSLVGRKRLVEIHPLTFAEFLVFSGHGEAAAFAGHAKDPRWESAALFARAFDGHIVYGGLPRIATEAIDEEKKNELKEIYDSYLQRDIKSFIAEEKVVPFNRLLRLLAAQVGNLVAVDELSSATKLKRDEVEEFLHILEQTHIIFFLSPFHGSLRKEITKMRKVFFRDTGLRNIIVGSFADVETRPDGGALFENAVIAECLKHGGPTDQFFFWRTQQGTEVDLVVRREGEVIPVEIKLGLSSLRGLRGLRSFCEHYRAGRALVVTRGRPSRPPEGIECLPACYAASVLTGPGQGASMGAA